MKTGCWIKRTYNWVCQIKRKGHKSHQKVVELWGAGSQIQLQNCWNRQGVWIKRIWTIPGELNAFQWTEFEAWKNWLITRGDVLTGVKLSGIDSTERIDVCDFSNLQQRMLTKVKQILVSSMCICADIKPGQRTGELDHVPSVWHTILL